RQGVAARHDFLHQTVAQRPAAVNAGTRLQKVKSIAGAQDRAQSLRSAVHQRDAPAAVENSKLSSLAGHPEVAPERELQPAREAVTLDGRDKRLAGIQAGKAERPRPLPARALGQ